MATDNKVPPYPAGPPTSQPPRKPDDEDEHRRIYRNVAVCTTDPIPWVIGRLQLGRADLSRMQTSGVPILLGHVPNEVVGVVTSTRESGDTWRSDWTIPKIQATQDTRDRMDTNILHGISVGGFLQWDTLEITNEDEVNNPDEWIFRADWLLIEESLTAIPADVRAGIDRTMISRTGPIPDLFIGPDNGIYTPATPEIRQRLDSLMRQHNQNVSIRRDQTMTMKPLEQTIPQEAIERAIASQLERNESLKALTDIPGKLDHLTAEVTAENERNMEYRAKLDKLQFQPGGQVLQLTNWNPAINEPLNIGRIIRLTADREMGFPQLDRTTSTLEESFLERQELAAPDRSTVARVPFEAVMERSRQRAIQRSAMADAAGARPLQVNVLGTAGLLFNDYAPILAAMDVRMGLRGSQKVPFFTAQGSAAGAAEAADIPITTYTMNNLDLLPVSIASAFDLSSSLQAADEGTFEALIDFAIFAVCSDQMVAQVLDGEGSTSNEIAGLWGRVSTATPDNAHAYGAAQSDFQRSDLLTTKNVVDLAKTDGGPGQWILGTGLYQLAENTLRGGASSERYLLEEMMMEGRPVHHYKDFAPSGTNDAGVFVKMDRCSVLIWGDSFQLQEIPVRARKSEYKLVVEANLAVVQPDHNLASLARS